MKIIHVGATGNIGAYVYDELKQRHEMVAAGRSSGDVQVDMTSADSIRAMYDQVGDFDALVCTAGHAHFGPFAEMKEEHFYKGIRDKMMGQINLVMEGKDRIRAGGSFTLTTGILAEDPVRGSVGLAFVNGAVNSFVIAAARELTRDVRINVVAAGLVEPSAEQLGAYFPGHIPVPMNRVVAGYVKSAEGNNTGEIIRIYG